MLVYSLILLAAYQVLGNLDTSDPTVQAEIVKLHNNYRRKAGSSNMLIMRWDVESANHARRWASQCIIGHDSYDDRKTSKFSSCGQNWAMWPKKSISWKQAVDMWHDEIKDFHYGSQPTGMVGHYTQLTWAKTFLVGCAYWECPGFHFYVCNYCPGGNTDDKMMPYKIGPPCGDCPDKCKKQLCNNPCWHSDLWTNCDEMKSWKICEDPQRKHECGETCNCPNA